MKIKKLFRTIVGLAIAFVMTFTPILDSYALIGPSASESGEQVIETQAPDEVPEQETSEQAESSHPEMNTEYSESADQTEPESKEGTEPSDGVTEKATKTKYVWKDETVRVTAVLSDAAAIPDDAELIVAAVNSKSDGYDYDAYMDALNEKSDSKYDAKNTLLYDIAFIKDGVEIQPESGTVSVTFEFLDNQLSESIGAKKASDVNVIHLPLKDKVKDKCDTTADAKKLDADDIVVEALTKKDNELAVSVKNEKVKFETSNFSVFAYTVDFEYIDPETGEVYTYNLAGEGSITLKELAIILGITTKADADEFISNVKDVKFSNEKLVKIQNTLMKGWVLKSLEPFSSEELLTIIMKDGTMIEVRVTDTQESTDLTNFLTNAIITGATQNTDGKYEVEAGKEYNIILSFAESSDYQFVNNGTLTYQMPEGIRVLEEQNEPMTINIVYKGRTYQVSANCHLGTDGKLSVTFDQNDPDYPRLEESTNVSFRFTYHALFDGTKEKIKFSEDIERDIVFDEPEPGQAYAKKSATYDETTGTFHYTIKVNATGDVTDVRVKDTIIGDALIFNNDVRVSGNSSGYRDNGASKGFDYTFASMREGEEITITYTGKVDFSKDTDGDGKITADQTKNTVSVEPKEGDPHTSDYSREIRFKYTVKKDGTVSSTTVTGDKIIDWEIDYNQLALAKAGGDTITDRISSDSTSYMKYYGSGITVVVKDHLGNIVRTDTIPYANLTAHSDSSWTYTIPDSDTKPYSYHITYQTIVDMEKVNGGGANVVLNNTANDDGGSVSVTPENKITVDKQVESFTTEEITWNTTLSIPENGLTKAVVTDTLPHIWLDNGNHYDVFKDYSLVISGLLDGEVYKVSYLEGQVVITFYKSYQDESNNEPGLKPSTGGRTINVRLTTMVDQEWLEKGYESGGWYQNHTNTIDFNSVIDTATVIFGKPGITKTADTTDEKSFKYTLTIAGLEDEPFSITDTFDTSLLEVDTSKNGTWNHMYIWGGNQYSQDSGHIPVSYTDTEDGIVITANTVPKDDNGKYYSYYKITYYLKLKDGVDLEQLAIANGGEYDIDNTAIWGEHETTYTYKKKYDFLDKELLNEGEIGGTNRTALYKITFNSAKATLNKGEPMEMTDVLSDNLSLDYGSVTITTDPPGAEVPYSVSGGKDDQGNPNGTTVATYTIPDSTKVEITYSAQVRGNGSQKIVNKVSVNGEDDTEEHTENYGAADEGEGAIASFKIVKVDGYNANKKLSGVKFKIFAEKPSLDFGGGKKELILETDENGEITLDGEKYKFFFNEIYHVQEIEAPEDYGQISFDYLVTLTNDMARVDYGHYIYYYSDSMQIKNWPLEGLIVEKQVDSDEAADKERYYTFRVSILDDEGKVDETYNEKNGDDQFENGVVEFQLKDREQKMFWGFKKGTKYKVEEIDADGFATSITYSIFDDEGNIIDTITAPGTSHSAEFTQEDEVIVFKNSKHNEVGSLKIKKTVTENGQAPSDAAKAILAGTYTFTLYTDEACKTPYTVEGQPKTVTLTIPDTGAAVTSEEVTDLPPGDYWIKETSPTNGSSPVTNPVKVKVEAGKTGEEAVIANFTNNLATGKGEIKVQKVLNGREWTDDDEFTFTLTGVSAPEGVTTVPMPEATEITIKKSDADQIKSFGEIKFTEAGTYTYTVKETKGTLGGVIYDETDHTVIIKVVDDGSGNLIAENGDSLIKVVTITNTYKARGVADVKVAKHLVGKTLEEGTFTFTISAVGNAPMNKANGTAIPATDLTVTNGADAEAVKFPTFYYTLEDAKKVYIYKIVEDDFNIPGVSRDTETGPEEIYAKITVGADNGDGTLADSTVEYFSDEHCTKALQKSQFINKYDAKGKATLKGAKDIEGRPFKSGDSATMKVEAVTAGAPLPDPAELTIEPTSGTSATFQFTDIEYDLSMIPEGAKSKAFKYKVTESAYTMEGVAEKDSTEYEVTVTISDNGDGTLKVEKSDNAESLNFKNKYDAKGKATLKGAKTIEGRPFKSGDSATMKVEAVTAGAPLPDPAEITVEPTDGTRATFQFEDIEYKLSMIPEGQESATFKYKVTESAYSMQGVGEKDSTEYEVTVTISDNGDGTLKVEKSENAESLNFKNKYGAQGKVTLKGAKTIEGRPFKSGDSATMKVEAVTDGAPLPDPAELTINPTSGTSAAFQFADIEYKLSMIPEGAKSKTFQYKVTESAYSMQGVGEKDSTEYTVTVTIRDKGNGELEVIKSDNAESLNFKNTYDAKGKATLNGAKTIEGRPFKEGDSATMKVEAVTDGAPLPDPAEITVEPTGGTSAAFQFADIEYDLSMIPEGAKSKTFQYKVTESAYSMQGVGEKDSTEYEVTVTISDNGDGTLKVEKSDNAESLNFKNKYDAKGKATLKGAKTIEGRPFKSGDSATMKVEAVTAGAPLPDPAELTIKPTGGTRATFQFEDIEYKLSMIPEGAKSKTFQYKVTESAYSMQGVGEKDSTEYEVTVTISDNGDGKLKVEKSENAESLVFKNIYEAKGTVTLSGKKDITGRPFKEGDSATMKIEALEPANAPMPSEDTVTVEPAEGQTAVIAFKPISYDLSMIPEGQESATFKYKVTESAYTMEGVPEKDSTEYTVTVTIRDKGDGGLEVIKSDNAKALNFTNRYAAKGKATLKGAKTIEGRPFKSGDSATMKVEAVTDGAPLPDPAELTINPTSGTSAAFQFADIEYDLSMIPEGAKSKSFLYKVTESAYSMQGVGEKDSTEYTVTVTISDNGDGKLKVEKSENAESLNFKNIYNAKGTATLKGAKDIEGRPFKSGDSATMKIEAVTTGAPLPDPAELTINPTGGTSATFQFADIKYDLSMIPEGAKSKAFKYKVTESAYTMEGVAEKDSTEYTVTVTISDNGDGKLKVEKSENAESLNFKNKYDAKGKATLKGAKNIEGRPFKSGDSATMKVEAVTDGAPLPDPAELTIEPTSGTSATFQFTDIEYDLSMIPEGAKSKAFKYKVTESAYTMEGVAEKDSTEYEVTVTISDNGDGTLKVEKSDNAESLNFKNIYDAKGTATLKGAKDIEGRPFKEGDSATMKIEAVTAGAPLPDPAEITVEPTDGTSATFQFADIEYKLSMIPEGQESATFKYKVTESAYSMQGVGEKDSTEYEVTVTISDNGDGTLKVEKSDNAESLNFKNKYDAKGSIPLKGTKKFKYGSFDDEEFTFSVYTEDGFSRAIDPGLFWTERDRNDPDFINDSINDPKVERVLTASTSDATVITDGKVSFDFKDAEGNKYLEYTLADIIDGEYVDGHLTKDFKYVVVEDIPEGAEKKTVDGVTFYYDSENDIKYDATEYHITITVTDNGDGTLKVTSKPEGELSFGFVNEKIYTELKLTKDIDSLVTGDTVDELTNVTCVFKVTYDDPILGRKVSRTVSVQFDAKKVAAETATVDKIPIEAEDSLKVEEVYAVDYTGQPKEGEALRRIDLETDIPFWTVAFENERNGNKTGSGVINSVEKNEDGFVITNRRDSTGKNPPPEQGDE